MEKQVNLNDLSADQRKALMDELKAKEQAEKERVNAEREAYKKIVSDTVKKHFPVLLETSKNLATQKRNVHNDFAAVIQMKAELFGIKPDQRSHTFSDDISNLRITVGHRVTDAYDDTLDAGIAKVRQFIGSLAKDADSQMLVDAIMKLLSRDQQGNLKASRVMQLRKMAEQSGNAEFIDGVRIIDDAYRPAVSKTFVEAEFKNDLGAWVSVPLGMTEA